MYDNIYKETKKLQRELKKRELYFFIPYLFLDTLLMRNHQNNHQNNQDNHHISTSVGPAVGDRIPTYVLKAKIKLEKNN